MYSAELTDDFSGIILTEPSVPRHFRRIVQDMVTPFCEKIDARANLPPNTVRNNQVRKQTQNLAEMKTGVTNC